MQILSSLSSHALIQNAQALIAQEVQIERDLLEYLREMDRRQLHLEMGFAGLYEFATQYLGLSEAAAYRRIAAMRLIREIPETRGAIDTGKLSLTNIAAAQTFFRAEKRQGRSRTREEKKEVLTQLEGLSKRACERKLLEIAPEIRPQERARAVTAELTELKLVLDAETMALITELKNARPGEGLSEVVKHAVAMAVGAVRKSRTPKTPPAEFSPQLHRVQEVPHAEVRRQVFAKADDRCEYISPDGKRCASTHALEIDHKTPRAHGGTDASENLRVLCRQHNGYEAVRILRAPKMQPYLPALTPLTAAGGCA